MSEIETHQRDLLEERGWIDRWGFLLFAFGGAAAILIVKYLGISPIIVAAGAAIAMLGYAYVVQTTGTGRLRADQAGDNCYYLGLIYTLTSLAYAIFFFDPANTATTIVQGFGIALATTIMGLVLRVFFNQSRVDLVETEDTARVELADAAGRLKAELQAMTVSMNDYGRETRQALVELREHIVASLVDVQEQATKSIADASAVAGTAISTMATNATNTTAEQANATLASARRLTAATEKVITGIEEHVDAMEDIQDSTSAIAESLKSLEAAAEKTQQNLAELAGRAEQLAETQGALGETGRKLQEVVEEVAKHIVGFDASTTRFEESLSARLAEVKTVPADMATKTSDAFMRATSAMEEQFQLISKAHQTFAEDLSRKAEAGVERLERHNAALERELDRSRDNVAKVHGALVEMTGTLVNRVQATNP
ncbi:hypothetical protein NUH86_18960 [Sphingobium sp. JS3065]|uniref:hypothetical protein n=1 Tax=Sphingobium sp. JS3065 TaxID=2970925 RepID=UPI002264C0DF|nr:hypothetical protein [Sphingobium sp. JS3065]UZW57656.1 hypothetical protein NUH86_18960 [Sphingobium sp. JS3065]